MGEAGFHSFSVLPLQSKAGVLGMTVLASREERLLGLPSIDTLMTIADQLGTAIENAQLYQEAQREVAERRRAHKALQESQERFQQVANNAQEWIWEVDAHGLYTYASPVVEKMLGYEPEEVVGEKHFYDLLHPEDREESKKAAFEVFAQKQPFREFINRNVRKDGATVWLSTGGVPMLDEEGDLLGYRGADTDITERKRMEEALRTSTRQWRATFDAIGDAVCLLDLQGGIQLCNEAMAELLGKPSSEIVGHTCWELVHSSSGPIEGCPIVRMKETRHREAIVLQDGDRWLNAVVDPVLDEDGGLIGAVHIMIDITERRQTEEALRRAHDELETRVQERTAELAQANEALRQERDLAEALAEAAAVIGSTLDPDHVLDRILEQASRVIPNDAANVMLIEDGQVHMARWRGYERFSAEEYISTLVFHIPEMPGLQQMIGSGEPLVISDTATHPSWVHVPEMAWLRSYAAAPIVVRGQVIGSLNADSATPGFFTQSHAETLRAFADHAAVAIKNARLFEQAQQEIAERMQAEQALRVSEERWRSLVENAPDVIAIFDLDGTILFLNRTISGIAVEERIGTSIYDYMSPEHHHMMRACYERVWQTGEPDGYEIAATVRPDGETLWFQCRVGAIKQNDQVVALTVISTDFTERKRAEDALRKAHNELELQVQERTAELAEANEALRAEIAERKHAEEALRESEATARALLNAPTDFAVLLDARGVILDANEAMARRFGRPVDELVGTCGWDLLPPSLAEGRRAYADQVVQSGEAACFEDERLGTWFDNVVYPVRDAQGKVARIAFLARDITERKQAEEEIRRRNRELTALNAIAATVSQSLNLEEVLSESLGKVLETMQLDTGAIRILNKQYDTLDLMVHRGVDLSIQIREGISIPKLAETLLAEAVATGEPLIAEDISTHPTVELIGRRDLRSLAVIPLRSKGQVLGIMSIASPDPRHFTSQDIQLLTSIGYQIGMAIDNATLYQETRNGATQLASLLETTQYLTSSLDLDRTLRLIVRHAAELLGTDICRLFLYDPATDELLAQMIHGVSDEDGSRVGVPLSQIGTAVEAQATLQPIVVQDTSQDHRIPDDTVEKWGIKSSLTVPLVAEGRFLGVIFLSETGAPRRFTASEVELAQSFASQAAIAIQNAQLYARSEELATAKERNRIACEIHDSLAQNLASLLMKIDFCLGLMDSDPQAAKEILARVKSLVRENIGEIRRSIFAIQRPELENPGFVTALREYARQFEEQNALLLHLSIVGEEVQDQLSPAHEYALFRILQEALTNARRHARADNVWIALDFSPLDGISLTVMDDGLGFDTKAQEMASSTWVGGFGLTGMKERAKAVRGKLVIESEPGSGAKITAILPLGKGG